MRYNRRRPYKLCHKVLCGVFLLRNHRRVLLCQENEPVLDSHNLYDILRSLQLLTEVPDLLNFLFFLSRILLK